MRLSQSLLTGIWLIIALNLLMAFGSIWIFVRMTPAIETIIDQNDRSIRACEDMLAMLSLSSITDSDTDEFRRLELNFVKALSRAKRNVTEKAEWPVLRRMERLLTSAWSGDRKARKRLVSQIRHLAEINRKAMIKADIRAKRLGNAGAWGVVFMAVTVFIAGMLFKQRLFQYLIRPIDEINSTIHAHQSGDRMRRFSAGGMPQEIKRMFDGLNNLLDNR